MKPLNGLPGAARVVSAVCALLALMLHASTASAQAGYVHQISGDVMIQKAPEKARLAKAGDKFDGNTLVGTGANGKVVLKFADGQIIALAVDSSLRIGRYHYDARNIRQSVSTVELLKGQMRFVAGLIGTANREALRIVAGDSAIGIRRPGGADFTISADPGIQDAGYAVVANGEISVRTPDGLIAEIAEGQYVPWRPGRTLPRPIPIAAAPAVVQAATAALWATVLPAGTPVTVASAAQAAVAAARPTTAEAALGPALAAVGPATDGAKAGGEPQPVGYVAEGSSGVSVKTAASGTTAASAGATFQPGSTIDTSTNGRAVLKFADGQIVVLGPGSSLTVSDYTFDPSNVKSSSVSVDLVNGAMRVITGMIHADSPAGISISAGASIIDALNAGSSDFTVAVDVKAQEFGVVRVTKGAVSVHTPYGAIDRIDANKSSLWGPRTTPDSPIAVATALDLVQAAVALQLSGLPDNAPVAVAAAARAAAQVAQAAEAQAAANANPQNAQLQAAAQAATELANLATQAAAAASEAIVAKVIATSLDTLPPTAAGTALAQAPAPIAPAVTPGAGGGCTGSVC